MEIYLAIITTALVIVTGIRVVQCADFTRIVRRDEKRQAENAPALNADAQMMRRAYTLAIAYMEKQLGLDKKHGHWVNDGPMPNGVRPWHHCSECGYKTINPTEECPKCTAVMDEKEEQK